jgi:hypothetical protein
MTWSFLPRKDFEIVTYFREHVPVVSSHVRLLFPSFAVTITGEFREGLFPHVASYILPMFSPLCCENKDGDGRVGEEEAPKTPAVETVKRLPLNDYHSFMISTQV